MLLLWCRLILVGSVCDVAQVLSVPLGVQSCVRVSPVELWGARMLHGVFMFGQALRSGGVYYLTRKSHRISHHTPYSYHTLRLGGLPCTPFAAAAAICVVSICFCLWLAANAN
jgi:hypothetical protein